MCYWFYIESSSCAVQSRHSQMRIQTHPPLLTSTLIAYIWILNIVFPRDLSLYWRDGVFFCPSHQLYCRAQRGREGGSTMNPSYCIVFGTQVILKNYSEPHTLYSKLLMLNSEPHDLKSVTNV